MQLSQDQEIALAAYYYAMGLSEDQISSLLVFSAMTAKRRLAAARDQGYLKESLIFDPPSSLEADIYPYLTEPDLSKQFELYFLSRNLKKAIIIPTISSKTRSSKEPDITPNTVVGRAAAYYMSQYLKDYRRKAEQKIQELLEGGPPKKEPLFSIGLDYAVDLDKDDVPKGLHDEFQKHERFLTRRASVTMKRAGNKWIVIDSTNGFFISKQNENLDVYELEKLIIGISFGRTVRELVEAARGYWGNEPKNSSVIFEFVPLMGELSVLSRLDPAQMRSNSASILAADLALTFRGDTTGQLTLPTPAFVPQKFIEGREGKDMDERIKTAQEFIQSVPEYAAIFGAYNEPEVRDKSSLLSQMDCMITSLGGPLSESEGGWLGQLGPIISEAERKQLEKDGVCGDICGRFLTADRLIGFSPERIISRVNARVFGPTPHDFMRCAESATKGEGREKPGVIVVANSSHKAKAVLSALNAGCVSVLIVDQELAKEILKLQPDIVEKTKDVFDK